MRSIALVLLLVVVTARAARAQTPALSRQQQYQQQKKSPAFALSIEALSPIAGMGGFYAGETDKATLLAILSGVSGGVAAGSIFWLVHLDDQNEGGVAGVANHVEQGAAISLLVSSALVYLLVRISGLALASEATTSFNVDLQERLGVRPDGTVADRALAPALPLTSTF